MLRVCISSYPLKFASICNQMIRLGRGQDDGEFGNRDEINMQIRNFLEDFSTAVMEKRVENLEDMYTKEYPKYCDQLFKQRLQGECCVQMLYPIVRSKCRAFAFSQGEHEMGICDLGS